MAASIPLKIILLGALLLCGCAEPRLTPLPVNGTILAFGDSLTVGVGAPDSASYPRVLERLSDRRVINAGVSGETTEQGLARLKGLLPALAPDLVVLLEGGNDILRGKNTATTKLHLAGMIEFAREHGAEVVLIGVPDKMLFSGAASFYPELAEEFGLSFDGKTLAKLVRDNRYKSDAIHLNAQGYRKLAESIHQLLVDNGAL